MAQRTTLRIVLENVDFRLPTQVTDDNSVVALKSLVFEPLLRWQPHGAVKPGLFDHWTHSPDGKTWNFHIRDSAIFHDRKICTAEDIVEYIHGILDSRDYFGMLWSYSRYFKNTKFNAVDERTVKVENPDPIADILDIFCEFWPSKIAGDGKPVLGTGPYRVTEFERANGIGRAKLERVGSTSSVPDIIIAIHEPDGYKRLLALRNSEVDVALNLERANNLNLLDLDDTSIRWGRTPSTLSAIYYLNCTAGIFQSSDARLAANLAIDRRKLVNEVYQDFATPSATIVSPFHLGFTEAGLEPFPYDQSRARALLEALSPSTSRAINLRTPEYMPEHAQKISSFVASSLEAVGFKVTIEVERNRPEYARQIGLHKQIGDLALFDSTPNSTFRVLDDKISSESHNTWWLGYHDEEVQRLFGEARQNVNRDDRAHGYAKCLRRLQENPPWLYIAHPHVVWATSVGLEVGINIGPSGVLTLSSV